MYKDFRNFARENVSGSILDSYFKPQLIQSPVILEERKLNVSQMDVFSRLMADRIIFLGDAIDSDVANIIQAQLLFLENTDKGKPINLYLNTPGGSVYAGLGIYDTMKFIKSPVYTTCTSLAASMGAILLSGGEKGHRGALKHSRVMIHQPSGGMRGTFADMKIDLEEMTNLKNELCEILSLETGKPFEEVEKDWDRDNWFKSDEALEYGLIDKIIK